MQLYTDKTINQKNSKGLKFFQTILSQNKAILVLSIILQFAGLLRFAATDLKLILPIGNSTLVDAIYSRAGIIEFFYFILAILLSISILGHPSPRFKKIFAALLFLLFGLLQKPWLTLFIYPFFIPHRDTLKIHNDFLRKNLAVLGVGVLFGSFFLMTLQSPFPHDSFKSMMYLQGFSIVFLIPFIGLTLVALSSAVVAERALIKLADSFSNFALTAITALIFLAFSLYSNRILSSFIHQFGFVSSPFMVAGFLTALILLLIESRPMEKAGVSQIYTLCQPILEKWFWIKFLCISLVFQQIIKLLKHAEQDILVVIIYDYLCILAPAIIVILSLGLAHTLVKKLSLKLVYPIILIGISIPVTASLHYATASWTVVTDIKRPYSKFITQKSRSILKHLHIVTEKRINDARIETLHELINNYLDRSDLTLQSVFHDQTVPILTAPNGPKEHFQYIFLFVADGVFAKHTSPFGYKRNTTPFLNRFQSESVNFINFNASSSATGLSIKSLFSGYYRGNNEAVDEHKQGSLCRSFSKMGYKSIIAGWSDCKKVLDPGDDSVVYLEQAGKRPIDRQVVWDFVSQNPNKKLFAYVHVKGGHGPWELEQKDRIFGNSQVDIYDELLFKADQEFEDFVKKIKELNIYDQSIIIFTSDHGVGLGYKYNDFTIYSNMYNVNMHIPFLIRIPGVPPKMVTNHYSLVDIRPTLEEIIGFDIDQQYHGQSFVNEILSNQPLSNRCVFGIATYSDRLAAKCPKGVRVVYNRDWSYLNIYQIDNDPYEQNGMIDQILEEEFISIIDPFAKFIAFGNQSYAKP